MLSNTSNSREFEREADAFAFQLLRKTGRSPRLLGEALAALEKQRDSPARDCPVPLEGQDAESAKPESGTPRRSAAGRLGYLSTHPATEERIKAAEEAAR
jgi:Zn-dependent protease with chaperone function